MDESDPSLLRLFVALELPSELERALRACVRALENAGASGVRWSRPEGIHLTLKFLGSTEASILPSVQRSLAELARETTPFEVAPAGLGTFGRPNAPRVVWVGLAGDVPRLVELATRIDQAVEPLGFAREDRPFSPHLTLGRVPRDATAADRRRIAEAVTSVSLPPLPAFRARNIELVASHLHPDGASYEVLHAAPLGQDTGR